MRIHPDKIEAIEDAPRREPMGRGFWDRFAPWDLCCTVKGRLLRFWQRCPERNRHGIRKPHCRRMRRTK